MERQVYQEKTISINSKCLETGETMPGNAVLFKPNILRYLLQMQPTQIYAIMESTKLHYCISLLLSIAQTWYVFYWTTVQFCVLKIRMATHFFILRQRNGHKRVVKELIKSSDPQDFKRMIATPNHKGKIAIDQHKATPR